MSESDNQSENEIVSTIKPGRSAAILAWAEAKARADGDAGEGRGK